MNKNVQKPKKILSKLAVVALVIAVAVTAGTLYIMNRSNANSIPDTINYGPPTEEEKRAGDEQKIANRQREELENHPPAVQPANIILIDANQYDNAVEIRAYISNVYEDGGHCTATLTKDGATVTRTSEAYKDATTTQCKALDIPRSQFSSPGDWQLTISYSSSATSGTTAVKNVTVK